MENKEKQQKNTTVYYDGECSMCSNIMNKIRTNQPDTQKLSYKNIHKDALPDKITKKEAFSEIHVVDSEGAVHKNIDALLLIAQQTNNWRLLTKIARLPFIKPILKILYSFVANHRHFLFGENRRIFFIKISTLFGLLSGLLISHPLWLPWHSLPRAPIIGHGNPVFLTFLEPILFLSLLGLIIYSLFSIKTKWSMRAILIFMLIYVVTDQIRLQPWFYQYFFILLLLSTFSWKHKDKENQNTTLNALRIIIISIYLYSGLQKINPHFIHTFQWMFSFVYENTSPKNHSYLNFFGQFIPFLETGLAISLLSRKIRNTAVVLLALMHVMILTALGPLFLDWNPVVWPWNIAMIALVCLLFWNTKNVDAKTIFSLTHKKMKQFIVVVFMILPILSFVGLWDSYNSFSLYSGNIDKAFLFLSESFVKKNNTKDFEIFIEEKKSGYHFVNLKSWSFSEIKTPIYPEIRVFKKIAKSFCENAEYDEDVFLKVLTKTTLISNQKELRFNCSNL